MAARASDRSAPAAGRTQLAVAGGAAVAFVVVLVLLGVQMRAGADPLLHSVRPPRRVVVKRIEERLVITHVISTGSGGGRPAVQSSSTEQTSGQAMAAPATRSS